MKTTNNIEKFCKQLDKEPAFIYREAIVFNAGYIRALFKNNLISRKEYNILYKIYADESNCHGEYFIEDGKLKKS